MYTYVKFKATHLKVFVTAYQKDVIYGHMRSPLEKCLLLKTNDACCLFLRCVNIRRQRFFFILEGSFVTTSMTQGTILESCFKLSYRMYVQIIFTLSF